MGCAESCKGCCSKRGCIDFMKKNTLLLLTITGVILGIVVGIAMREANLSQLQIAYFGLPGELFLRALKMVIVPLVAFSLITGVATLDRGASGRLGLRAIVYYILTTLVSVILGIILVVAIQPGSYGSRPDSTGNEKQAEAAESLTDLLRNLVPTNIVSSTFQKDVTDRIQIPGTSFLRNVTDANGTVVEKLFWDYKLKTETKSGTNVLGLITFCLMFGIIIGGMGEQGKILVKFFVAANEAIMRMVGIIIWTTPIGLLFLIASKIMSMERPEDVLTQLAMYIVTVTTGLLIHGLIILPLLYFAFTRTNPFKYAKGMLQALLTALATASSAATLPVTVNCVEANKVDRRVSRFVLPIGATINMDGTALYEGVACLFIAQVNNIELSFGQIVTTVLTATFASIGAAGVPEAGLVTLVIVLQAVNLPVEDITLILAIDWMLDRFRTTVNVWGDSVGAAIIAKLSKDDLKQMDKEEAMEAGDYETQATGL